MSQWAVDRFIMAENTHSMQRTTPIITPFYKGRSLGWGVHTG